MKSLTTLIAGSLTASTLAYIPSAPIQWMNRVVMLEGPAGPFRGSTAPQPLLMKDRPSKMSHDNVPFFTLNFDDTITLEGTGSCIEAVDAESGNAVRLSRCTGGPTQRWNWIPDSQGGNRIQLKNTNKCLDASVGGGFSGVPIVLWECESKGAEAWKFEETVPLPNRGRHIVMSLMMLAGVAALSFGARLRQYTGPRKLVPIPSGATSSVNQGGVALSLPLAVQMRSSPSNASQRRGDVPERTEVYPNDPKDRQPAILHLDTLAKNVAKRKIVLGKSSRRSGDVNMGISRRVSMEKETAGVSTGIDPELLKDGVVAEPFADDNDPGMQKTVIKRLDTAAIKALEVAASKMATVLSEQPRFFNGQGVTVQEVYDLLSPDMSEEDFDNAFELLENQGLLRVQEGETDDDDDLLFDPKTYAVFDRTRHLSYDYEAEADARDALVQVMMRLKRFGVDASDAKERTALEDACVRLANATAESPAPPIRDDPRLEGDWELVATSSETYAKQKGLSGLGAAPFSNPIGIFLRFLPDGGLIAKEVIESFGNLMYLNEFRGVRYFPEDGSYVKEEYSSADLGGQRNSTIFSPSGATFKGLCITTDGAVRLCQSSTGNFFVFKKLGEGQLEDWLKARRLPLKGGSSVSLTPEEYKESFPYLPPEK